VRKWQSGEPRSVLKGLTLRGFAFVSEKTMENVLTAKKKDVPVHVDEDVDRKTELQMACIAAVDPTLNETQATLALHNSFMIENPDTYSELMVPPELIQEVVVPGEAKAVSDYATALSQAVRKKEHMQATRDIVQRNRRYFKPAPAVKWKKEHKHAPKWTAELAVATSTVVAKWIDSHKPESVLIVTDDKYGRFRVVGPTKALRSVSWTRRGWKEAAMEVLHTSWLFHTDALGSAPPFDWAALQQEFSASPGFAVG
jgi:hypothetical protein